MNREAMESEHEELTDLEYLRLLVERSHGPRSSAPFSAATQRPRTPTRIRSRPSPASAPAGLLAPRVEGLIDIAAMEVNQDQTPEGQQQDPEFDFVMVTTPSMDDVHYGVPLPEGGIVPPTPFPQETAVARPRVVLQFQSAGWVWIHSVKTE